MRRPKDISVKAYKRLLREVGDGMRFLGSMRIGSSRYFRFEVQKKRPDGCVGDYIEYPLAVKHEARNDHASR